MDQLIQTATEAAVKAGDYMKTHQFDDVTTRYKGSTNNIVTEVDVSCQQLISQTILSRYPDHHLFAEESDTNSALSADNLWVIDPLDGTSNFANRIPHCAVSIAFAAKGIVYAGVIYDPWRSELFYAIRGTGAFLNGTLLRIPAQKEFSAALIATGFYYDRGELMEKTLKAIGTLLRSNVRDIRRSGSAALDLAWIAAGRFDGYFEYRLSPWDFAAGMLIVTEAGGRCSDPSGNTMTLESSGIIASNAALHGLILEKVKI